jgi:HJR/Mrr/RecB family endonuclease
MNNYVFPAVGIIILIAFVYLFYTYKKSKSKNNHFENILKQISDNGFENNVVKFIDSFGKEGRNNSWKYRDYTFDWKRLDDFRDNAIQSRVGISKENYSEILAVLKHYIDKKERNYLNQSLEAKSVHSISELGKNGNDFENLVTRLYDAMGYASKRIGGHGDQGGDVIANKNGESLLVQAKCYQGSVGNAAVQQAVAARQQYGCTKAVVITTSYFTPEATELARSNSTELIDGKLLKQRLSEYLREVWQ